jgi:hypothetical protein
VSFALVLTGRGKTLVFEGYGLLPVRQWLQIGPALTAEVTHFIPLPLIPQPVEPRTFQSNSWAVAAEQRSMFNPINLKEL